MGFRVGSWGFLHSNLSLPFSSSSPPPASPRLFVSSPCFYGRDVKRRKNKAAMALASPGSSGEKGPMDYAAGASRRWAVLLVGISALPFLKLRAISAEDLAQDIQNHARPETAGPNKPTVEVSPQPEHQSAPGTSFISILNALGIVGTGILGALYALSQKEKADIESTFDSMKAELAVKEEAVSSMKESFNAGCLIEQEERKKQAEIFKEDQASLLDQLASANEMVADLQQELDSEKNLNEKVKEQINQYRSITTQAAVDHKELEAKLEEMVVTIDALQDSINLLRLEISNKDKSIDSLKSSFDEKESENEKLKSTINQLRADIMVADSTFEQLKEELNRCKEELNSNISSVKSLKERLQSLQSEKDESLTKFEDLMEEFNHMKAVSEKRAALDSELLSEKEEQLHQLEEKLQFALSEARNHHAVIEKMSEQQDRINTSLQQEVYAVKSVKDELQATQESLRAAKDEAANLYEELAEAKRSYENSLSEASKINNEFHETKDFLIAELEESKSTSKLLSDELLLIKELLRRTEEDLDATSGQLRDTVVERESLEKELLQAYKKLESTVLDLQGDRKVVSSLNSEHEILRKQVHRDSEARRSLEADLDEAIKSLDEMNKSALLLSRELESSNSIITSLEAGKGMLFRALTEQKNTAKTAQENLEDAQNLITRLASERENLEKRCGKLDMELASAKGEILRLRRKITTAETVTLNGNLPRAEEAVPVSPPTAKKVSSRRRKGRSTSEAPK